MPILNKNFIKSSMDKDSDERLLPNGRYRHAENLLIIHSEGSDVGSAQNSLSNKQLTNYNFGPNPKCLLGFSDEVRDRIYWFVKSDSGCYLVEWDNRNEILSIVLADTRTEEERVLRLDENFLITGIDKIINNDINKDLLLWSDDNMQPCCINIERAKSYGVNGFDEEDILLIKKPPRYAPKLTPFIQNALTNNIENKFLSFCYRYKYLDGEYSALSELSDYGSFVPRKFELDYFNLDNLGMINKFNAVKVEFNTGDKRVTDIQLVVKESRSNNLYIVETFNKEQNGWADDELKNYIFSNNKLYTVLPEKELYRLFDNVPLKAKALTIIGNLVVLGNYVEGYNIEDKLDYSLSLVNKNILEVEEFFKEETPPNYLVFSNPENFELKNGKSITFSISINLEGAPAYSNDFSLILEKDYSSIEEFFESEEFETFLSVISSDYAANYTYDIPSGWVVQTETKLELIPFFGYYFIYVSPVVFEDTSDSSIHEIDAFFDEESLLSLTDSLNSSSCKTNKDYEVGIVYLDKYNRSSTVLTSLNNTIHIPQKYSSFKNNIRATINSKAPEWAERYKIVVKTKPLEYQTIFINEFYNEDDFVWCRLVAENIDKVKVGDELIIKKSAGVVVDKAITVKVVEIKEQLRDFIIDNKNEQGVDIIEPAGMYMKIRPNGFSMDYNDYKIYTNRKSVSAPNGSYPVTNVDLWTDTSGPTPVDLALPSGTSIYIYINNGRDYNSGWSRVTYSKTFFTKKDYISFEEWFNENLLGKDMFAERSDGGTDSNYKGKVFVHRVGDKLILVAEGLQPGGSGGRRSYLDLEVTIRTSSGFYVFETSPKQAETGIFYETGQCFDIVNRNHQSNYQNQDADSLIPAIVDLNFYNCYVQGNGIESYKIKDGFNTNSLNIDLRPNSTSVDGYKQVRRYSDFTFSNVYNESTNINGLNEFNLSLLNFKELDKQNGSIQKLFSRDNDLLVFQEEKTSKVLFKKNMLFGADGSGNIVSTSEVFGEQVTFIGENGIGLNPESFAVNDFQIFFSNARRGVVQRLSIDGVSDIVSGMVSFFRNLFIEKPTSIKLGGFDPYHKQYFLTLKDEFGRSLEANCGNVIVKTNLSSPFTYLLKINSLEGDIILDYNITLGNATIEALFDEDIFVESNVTGTGSITIPRTNLVAKTVVITITPVTELVDIQISNTCPLGKPMKLITVVLNDSSDIGKNIINRFNWNSSSFYSENELFDAPIVSKFLIEEGIEGVGKFPRRGNVVSMQSYKDALSSGSFESVRNNKLGYLVTDVLYDEADYETIRSLATFITTTETFDGLVNVLNSGNFLFNRTDDQNLYLIWDYCSEPYNFEVENYSDTEIKVKWLGNKDCTLTIKNLDTLEESSLVTNFNQYTFYELSPFTNYEITLKPNCCTSLLTLNQKTMITRKYGTFEIGDIATAANITGNIASAAFTNHGDWDAGHGYYDVVFDTPVESANYNPIITFSNKTGLNSSSFAYAVDNKTTSGFRLHVRDVAVSASSYGLTTDAKVTILVM